MAKVIDFKAAAAAVTRKKSDKERDLAAVNAEIRKLLRRSAELTIGVAKRG
jgi:hypothetical protein